MQKLNKNEQKHRHCDWCKKDNLKVKALYKLYNEYACENHKTNLQTDYEELTEADYQTWYRI